MTGLSGQEYKRGGHHIETESATIWLPGPGPVIQCNVATVSLLRPRPRPRLDREGGSVADISELNNVI